MEYWNWNPRQTKQKVVKMGNFVAECIGFGGGPDAANWGQKSKELEGGKMG
jgi:hypothetical protein